MRRTRIPREYLEALENGRLEVIPSAIRRGVVAAYVQASGMNSDKVLKTLESLQGIQPASDIGTLTSDRSTRERLTVGMTRAQIQTAWFASIAGNRFLHWSLTVLLLLVGVLLAAQWRDGAKSILKPSSPAIYVHDPVTSFRATPVLAASEVPLESLTAGLVSLNLEAELMILDTGKVHIFWGLADGPNLNVYPYDKVKITANSGIRVALYEGARGYLIASKDTLMPHFTKDSAAVWLSFPDFSGPEEADTIAVDNKIDG